MHKTIFSVSVLAGLFTVVISYPADHREDTVLPFSLSPGNVNLETYYLGKYPQPGNQPPSGGNMNPIKQQLPIEPEENMMLWDDNEGYDVMSRARREANPQHHHHHGHHHHHHGAYHHYPSYGHHHHRPYYNYYNNYNPYHHHHHHHGR